MVPSGPPSSSLMVASPSGCSSSHLDNGAIAGVFNDDRPEPMCVPEDAPVWLGRDHVEGVEWHPREPSAPRRVFAPALSSCSRLAPANNSPSSSPVDGTDAASSNRELVIGRDARAACVAPRIAGETR